MHSWSIYPIEKFSQFAKDWDSLNSQTFKSRILDSRFVAATLDYFGNGSELLAVYHDNNSNKAFIIVQRAGVGQWQTFQASQSPLGAWIADPGVINDRFYRSLIKKLPGVNFSLSFTQIDPDHLPRPNSTTTIKTIDYITTGRLSVPDDFEQYWSERSRNVKQNFNRANNRLKKQDIEVSYIVQNKVDEMSAAVATYGDIESASWKAESGTSVSRDNKQGAFYKELLETFAPEQAEVWQYYYNDQVVATDLCIRDESIIYILKTTFLEEWKKYSPAFHMHIDGVKELSRRELNLIEFYGPAMEWHKKLTDDLRTMYHLNWYRWPIIVWLKNLIKRLKNRTK